MGVVSRPFRLFPLLQLETRKGDDRRFQRRFRRPPFSLAAGEESERVEAGGSADIE
jgi:hypothetical protein